MAAKKQREGKGPGSQDPLQGRAPVINFPSLAPPIKDPTTSQQCLGLVTKP
jgi:hypothetical protein